MNYQHELKSVYDSIHSGGFVNSLIGLSVFLGIAYISRRIYLAYRDYNGEKEKDIKLIFELIKEYAVITAIIVALPFGLRTIETVLADVQENVSKNFNASVELTATQAIAAEVERYKSQYTPDENNRPTSFGRKILQTITLSSISNSFVGSSVNMFLLGITKYIYFFFCAGRYLWLLMLEVMAPVALVSFLDDDRRKTVFEPWLKNMMICYLLVPFFLLADVFGEQAIRVLAKNSFIFQYNQTGLLATLGILVLKIALYKIAAQRAFNLIN